MIKDSGHRREFDNGFVRDMSEGKGSNLILPENQLLIDIEREKQKVQEEKAAKLLIELEKQNDFVQNEITWEINPVASEVVEEKTEVKRYGGKIKKKIKIKPKLKNSYF